MLVNGCQPILKEAMVVGLTPDEYNVSDKHMMGMGITSDPAKKYLINVIIKLVMAPRNPMINTEYLRSIGFVPGQRGQAILRRTYAILNDKDMSKVHLLRSKIRDIDRNLRYDVSGMTMARDWKETLQAETETYQIGLENLYRTMNRRQLAALDRAVATVEGPGGDTESRVREWVSEQEGVQGAPAVGMAAQAPKTPPWGKGEEQSENFKRCYLNHQSSTQGGREGADRIISPRAVPKRGISLPGPPPVTPDGGGDGDGGADGGGDGGGARAADQPSPEIQRLAEMTGLAMSDINAMFSKHAHDERVVMNILLNRLKRVIVTLTDLSLQDPDIRRLDTTDIQERLLKNLIEHLISTNINQIDGQLK